MTPTIIEGLTIYRTDFCSTFTGDTCIEWTSVQSLTTDNIKELSVEVGGIIIVFGIIITLVLYFLKYVLRAIFPQKSRF